MTEELDIILTGLELEHGQVEAGIVRVFGIDPRDARRLLRELPAVAKSGAPRAVAERYVAALRSIGARVELRPTGSRSTHERAAGAVSLPLPAPEQIARVDESIRVQRETARAIKRFRAAEGLDAESLDAVDPENPSLDLWNPEIPKAPLVPRDLAKLRNAARRFSDPPSGHGHDDGDGDTQEDLELAAPARSHADAQLPPPVEERHSRPSHVPSSSDHFAIRSRRPSVGLAHAATASIRPGLSSYFARSVPQHKPRRLRALWALALLLLLTAGAVALWLSDSPQP
jgi:hypothetical protein